MSDARIDARTWSLLRDGRQYEFQVEIVGAEAIVTRRGRTQRITVSDPREWQDSANGRGHGGLARIVSPMPGKVVRVLVEVGDQVAAGDGLVVVEAMKMQNEMKSPIAGKVTRVATEPAATVQANQVLVEVEANAS